MPWDHAAFGYIAFSLFVHAVYDDTPSARETTVVVFAAVLPDLIDKPLAWQFGLLEGGRTLGHSVFIAFPLAIAVGVVMYLIRWPRLGLAFGVGYLLHLPGDVIPGYFIDGELKVDTVLWPVTEGGGGQGESFVDEFMANFGPYVRQIVENVVSGEVPSGLLILLIFWAVTVLLWIYDGMPVLREGFLWFYRSVGPFTRK